MPTQIGIVIGSSIASPYGLPPKPSPPQSSPPKSKK